MAGGVVSVDSCSVAMGEVFGGLAVGRGPGKWFGVWVFHVLRGWPDYLSFVARPVANYVVWEVEVEFSAEGVLVEVWVGR